MPASSLGRGRSRPVADAPRLDGAALAKAWLVELVGRAPLERAARLPGVHFAEEAPRLCGAVAEALASDAALTELETGGALAPLAAGTGRMAAAGSPQETVGALDALRAVVWAEVIAALPHPASAQIAELADRLAAVVAVLTAAALDAGPVRPGDRSGPLAEALRDARHEDDDETPAGDDPQARAERLRPRDVDTSDLSPRREPLPSPDLDLELGEAQRVPLPPRPGATRAAWANDRDTRPRSRPAPAPRPRPEGAQPAVAQVAVLRDETQPEVSGADTLAHIEATLREAASAADPLAEAAARLRTLAETADLDLAEPDLELELELESGSGPAVRTVPEFEDAGDLRATRLLPWTAAIERRLVRHREDGLPFAVLCLELADVDRLVSADRDRDVLEALEAAEGVILDQLRPADGLVRERAGRYWLTTPDTDAAEGRALALRIAGAIADLPPHRGAPLEVAIGVTACPSDAAEASALEERAEEGLFAARAAGLRVAGPPR